MSVLKPFRLYFFSFVCILAGGCVWWFYEQRESPSKWVTEIEREIDLELRKSDNEAEEFVQSEWTEADFTSFHFIADGTQVKKWSTQLFAPDISTLAREPIQFLSTSRGDFIVVFRTIEGKSVWSLIPLFERFRITNKYLGARWNTRLLGDRILMLLDVESPEGELIKVKGQPLFKVRFKEAGRTYGAVSFFLLALGCLSFVVGIVRSGLGLAHAGKPGLGFCLLLAPLVLLRYGMLAVNFPGAWIPSPVFDPATFASSSFNATLGDLLLNSLMVLSACIYLFVFFFKFNYAKRLFSLNGLPRMVAATLFLVLSFFGFLFPFLYFETIANNSAISVDWTQSLDFDLPRGIAYTSILLGIISSFLFCHVVYKTAFKLIATRSAHFLLALAVSALLLWVYAWLLGRDYTITILVGVLFFSLLYFSRWHRYLARITFLTFIYLLCAMLFHAAQNAVAVKRLIDKRNTDALYRFGNTYLVDRDVLGEYLLNEASWRIADDPFIQIRLGNPFFGKSSIRQKVRLIYLNSYFDRYETRVHLFSPSGNPLDDQSNVDFASFINQYQPTAGSTGYKGIYFIDQGGGEQARSYVAVVPVLRSGRTVGYITIVLTMKRVVPRSVYPQLLVDHRFAQELHPSEYSYAVFRNDTLVSNSGEFNYAGDFKARSDNQFQHLFITGEGGLNVVMTSKVYSSFRVASNFSFWVLMGVAVVLCWLLAQSIYRFRTPFRLNYASRIQLYVYGAFVVPLIAVSVTTLNWTSRSAREQLSNEFEERARVMSEKISPGLEQSRSDSTDNSEFGNYLTETAKLAGVDATAYLPEGKLYATSQPLIFDSQILSKWVNPRALDKFLHGENSFVMEEQVGELVYNNAYSAMLSSRDGKLLGILSMPFFESASSLEKGRIAILSNVLILFVIILVIFTLLSFVATQWLTFPLQLITKSLGKTGLKEENKLLDWKTDDEIGLMVREYNKMVRNLEKSKIELARNQKESAWREMAQQVAHEIKNPLTPMKLTLQQMEWSLRNGDLSSERVTKSLTTLLTQLEILNEIAISFSSFAKMPAPILTRLELTHLLKQAVDLHSDSTLGRITLANPIEPIFIKGDEQLMTRVFSNLFLNALQSGADAKQVEVMVRLAVEKDQVLIFIKDNGVGMDAEQQTKIFTPHFTTKKTGSGLGLAIVRQGVELSGGTITFTSASGQGTTFTLSFPLAR